MSVALRSRPTVSAEETRARIIAVAEEHFRRVGYAKTAVADVASELGMSPANVYRFFPSKAAINEAICQRLMGVLHEMIGAIAAEKAPAAVRLPKMIRSIHEQNKAMLTHEKRIFDMVEVAMTESWPAIDAHCHHCMGVFAEVVRQGVEAGEFGAIDPQAAGNFVFHACAGMFHPTLIAQFCDQDFEADAANLIAFILRALRP
jgi:AcrR family transcriptional regulator